jgi:hypothetical protein
MTLVVVLEQRFQSVAQVDRRANHRWCRLSKDGCFKVIEAREKVTEEEESFEDGRTETSMYKSAEARDFHKPQAIMTAMDTPIACAAEEPPRRKEWPVHLTPGGVGMSSSTKRRSSHSVMIPELLNHDAGSSSRTSISPCRDGHAKFSSAAGAC